MNTVSQLGSELSNLVSESRRRNSEIKQASEKSLDLLKSYNSSTNELDFLHSLSNQHDFIKPFLLSCQTRNAKFSAISIQCLNKLILTLSVPSNQINEVLDAFMEASHLGMEIQLKILQILPQLFQNYKNYIKDELVLKILMICSVLQSGNKSTVVINTSAATLQQLIVSIFDKVKDEDQKLATSPEPSILKTHKVPIDGSEFLIIGDNAYDAQRIFLDLCLMVEHHKPFFLKFTHLNENSGFELIENILTNNTDLFLNHVELGFLVRTRVIPILLRNLSSSRSFSVVVRVARIIYLLLGSQLQILRIECEVVLSLLTHLMSTESGSQPWKKILCLEIFNGLLLDFRLIEEIFNEYDASEDRKNVLYDFLIMISTVLADHKGALGISSVLKSGSPAADMCLSIQQSTIKVAYLDSLDKSDAPSNTPSSYLLYLILNCTNSLSDGIGKFAINLSSSNEKVISDKENGEITFITSLVKKNWPILIDNYTLFLYANIDSELFHSSVRCLQKICQAAGLLGQDKARDEVLKMLATATINIQDKPASAGSRPLLSLGESIVETISSTISQTTHSGSAIPSGVPHLYPRNINSRNVTCLRALVSLAISLGATLQDSWKIIFITLQWMDYYVNGSDEISKNLPPPPSLSPQELMAIDNSYKKLVESVKDYSNFSFYGLCKPIVELSEDTLNIESSSGGEAKDEGIGKSPLVNDSLQVCVYNRIFYINKLMEFSKINSRKFLIENNKNWDFIIEYFISLGIKRTSNLNLNDLRVRIVKDFDSIIKYIAIEGFNVESASVIRKESKESIEKISSETAKKTLNALMHFIDELLNLEKPSELLILNAETEIHLEILKTLQYLIDKYDIFFKDSWVTVFKILNSPFKLNLGVGNNDANLNDKVNLLVKSSFETLKLILDEFLNTLPPNQIKMLIDSLFNFSSQTFDLNISFNSISYFWLISDSLRTSVSISTDKDNSKIKEEMESIIKSESDLLDLTSQESDSLTLFNGLWIYLLLIIAKVSVDQRALVRNGAIQTFFRVIDSHGSHLPSWKLIYNIVLPNLLSIRPPMVNTTSNAEKKEWIESLNLVLSGLVSLYTTFIIDFKDEAVGTFWEGLIDYFKLILEINWLELNLKIFKSFSDILTKFHEDKLIATSKIRHIFLEFWFSIDTGYNFVDNKLYQDSLSELMDCFPALFHILKKKLSLSEAEGILSSFNSCVRYPILPESALDNRRCTKLQNSIMTNLESFIVEDDDINSLIFQQLSSNVILPFSTRDRIEKKLESKLSGSFKIPTFIAVSHLSLSLLSQRINEFPNFGLLVKDRTILKVIRALLEAINLRSKGIEDGKRAELWMEASNLLLNLVKKVCALFKEDDYANEIDQKIKAELWDLVLESVKLSLQGGSISATYEPFSLAIYQETQKDIIPNLNLKSVDPMVLEKLVQTVYDSSYLYSKDEIEEFLLETSRNCGELAEKVVSFDFRHSYGTTKSLRVLPSQKTNLVCLSDLIGYTTPSEDVSNRMLDIARPYLICRIAFALRKLISDEKLVNRAPLPKIQETEITRLLQGLLAIQLKNSDPDVSREFAILYPLLIKATASTYRVKKLQAILEQLLEVMDKA